MPNIFLNMKAPNCSIISLFPNEKLNFLITVPLVFIYNTLLIVKIDGKWPFSFLFRLHDYSYFSI